MFQKGMSGKVFRFNILSNWGDKFYVGLTGIELFGKIIKNIN